MQGPYLRKYGEAAALDFVLYATDGASLKTDAVHASGDTKVMKDEGAEANTSNAFVDEGQGYSLALTATEMQAARVVVYVVDQTSPKAWLDTALVVETYGHASAQHAFDLDTASVAQTGDSYARLGAPAGASIAADIATVDAVVDAVKTKTDNLPADPADDSDIDTQLAAIAGYLDTEIAATNELQADWADGGRLDLLLDAAAAGGGLTAADIADAVWEEATADHQTAGTMGKALTSVASPPGSGAITFTYTLTSSVDGSPIADADVWVTSDAAGNDVLASGETNSSGQVVFYLDAGTVYVWRAKAGWNFSNPDTEVVA